MNERANFEQNVKLKVKDCVLTYLSKLIMIHSCTHAWLIVVNVVVLTYYLRNRGMPTAAQSAAGHGRILSQLDNDITNFTLVQLLTKTAVAFLQSRYSIR